MTPEGPDIRRVIEDLLRAQGRPYEVLAHRPVRSAADAARARGLPLEAGAKAIVLKTDDAFHLFALRAADRLRSAHVRRALAVRRTRFATARELAALTGLVPGAVPPFGRPVLPLDLFADPRLLEEPTIAFTPGVRDASILLAPADWAAVARPTLVRLAA